VYSHTGYLCDPHGACGYEALNENLSMNQMGVFLETAHPAKFTGVMEEIIGPGKIPLPEKLAVFMKGVKKSIPLGNQFAEFKEWLLSVKTS
jgi:threonine synthase